MSRVYIATRGIASWRERLANPDRQWKRSFSAFETAVSWERVSGGGCGLPVEIAELLHQHNYPNPILVSAIAEHRVPLPGGASASQSDVWAVIQTQAGFLSLTVEAKARESFGDELLEKWLTDGDSERSITNRRKRWEYVRAFLPASESFMQVRYQILHRCAAAVMEAKRLGFSQAAFIVQAFNAPESSFQEYSAFCRALKIPSMRGQIARTLVHDITLGVGWVDSPLATDRDIAAVV